MKHQAGDTVGMELDGRKNEGRKFPFSGQRWMGWFRMTFPGGGGFESSRYLVKWLVLSTAIGIVAGLGAIAFFLAIQWATELFLGGVVGYLPPGTVGEGSVGIQSIVRPWLLPIVTGLGGLISGLIVFSLAPEAEGHGTDAAIAAIHHKRSYIRARIPPIKLIASAITIGSGGSGGREGPAAQISAGFGSLLGVWLRLDERDRRIAVAAGMGAGIGAIFRAPLGGALMAVEILYIHDLEVEALIPALMASIVGYSIFGMYFGFAPIFGDQPGLALGSPMQLVYYAALGIACGLVGIVYARSFYGIAAVFHRLSLPRWLKPALGGVLVGGLGLLIPGALHMGYGWVQIGMGQELLGLPIWVVLLLPFAKILATSLSIGSGGSGGIFGPGMVIGGMLGASFWRMTEGVLPNMPASPAPFVIIGMMALFGGIAHAPLAVMLMVAEMTGNLSLLAPAMVAVAISTALVGDNTIYRSQLPDRASAPAHRMRFSFPLLSSLLVRDAIRSVGDVVASDATVSEAEPALASTDGAVILNRRGEYEGILWQDRVQSVPAAQRAVTYVTAITDRSTSPLRYDQTLDTALEQLAEDEASWAPVVENHRVVGKVHVRDVVEAYRSNLSQSVRRVGALPQSTVLLEVQLDDSSPLQGRTLREAALPADTLVLSVEREGDVVFPRANTKMECGDLVMILADKSSAQALQTYLRGSATANGA